MDVVLTVLELACEDTTDLAIRAAREQQMEGDKYRIKRPLF
jgi:hypothetical protein